MLDNEQMEIIDVIFMQIKQNKAVGLHQVNTLLSYALSDIGSKKDLCDGDILTIKSIRQQLKGL